jgi:hypothetical protein
VLRPQSQASPEGSRQNPAKPGTTPLQFLDVLTWLAIAAYTGAAVWLHLNRPVASAATILAVRYLLLLPALVSLVRRPGAKGAHTARASADPTRFLPSVRTQAAIFVLAAAPLAWYWGRGQTVSDESAYRFQARLFAAGRIAAVAPPVNLKDFGGGNETPLAGCILYRGRWFSKYPPGWPVVLAVADRLGAGWLAPVLLTAVILLLTGAFAASVFDETTARLAVLLAIASPYFLFNSMGYLAHPLCGVLVAAAAYFCFLAIRREAVWPYWAMFAALALAMQVRPYTAFCVGLVLGPIALWQVRKTSRRIASVLAAGITCGAFAIGAMALYNHALTGSYWRSTYALSRGLDVPIEVTPSVALLQKEVLDQKRWSMENTAVNSFPFLFLLGFWCVMKESRQRREVAVLGLLFAVVVSGYLVQRERSTCAYGERYYFEVFFAVCILAARGISLLSQRPGWSVRSCAHAVLALLVAQACVFAVLTPKMLSLTSYSARVYEAFRQVSSPGTVFFLQDPPGIDAVDEGRKFNPNVADWPSAPVFYLPDPGFQRRDAQTRLLGRSRWILFRDGAMGEPHHVDSGQAYPVMMK